jgi:uncharacterized OB-fold protein
VTDTDVTTIPYGDAFTAPFWAGARRHELLLQCCDDCGSRQHYPRPMCLACGSLRLSWTRGSGLGTVYSRTTVHIQVEPDRPPPYVVAVVQLDEGPRMLTTIVGGSTAIGDRVRLAWQDRGELPPLPVFEPVATAREGRR